MLHFRTRIGGRDKGNIGKVLLQVVADAYAAPVPLYLHPAVVLVEVKAFQGYPEDKLIVAMDGVFQRAGKKAGIFSRRPAGFLFPEYRLPGPPDILHEGRRPCPHPPVRAGIIIPLFSFFGHSYLAVNLQVIVGGNPAGATGGAAVDNHQATFPEKRSITGRRRLVKHRADNLAPGGRRHFQGQFPGQAAGFFIQAVTGQDNILCSHGYLPPSSWRRALIASRTRDFSGKEMASGPQVLAQARQKTTQFVGLATISRGSSSRISYTWWGQNLAHSRQ
ncbi:signal transduction histidine kinase [Moorella thermoacetica Y72]|uniref:Signal transduction histidine kinase n=1 Tax=Moorella thermoacetica Y72 TaxID=1325331 RepID=A0A0S6UDE9_NEOTH|nr:signal transduction histidine kinase [Moorella thermoacetica Y72]